MDDRLARVSRDALADYRNASDAWSALEARVKPDLSPEAWGIVEQLLESRTMQMEASTDLFFAELVRHFPGMAPALATVWNHVSGAFFDTVGTCCTPTEGADDGN